MERHAVVYDSIKVHWEQSRDGREDAVECWARCRCGVEFHGSGPMMSTAVDRLEQAILRHLDAMQEAQGRSEAGGSP